MAVFDSEVNPTSRSAVTEDLSAPVFECASAKPHFRIKPTRSNLQSPMLMLKNILILMFLISSISSAQTVLEPVEFDGDVPNMVEFVVGVPETDGEKQKRIQDQFGPGASAITLVEQVHKNRKALTSEEIREGLTDARTQLTEIENRFMKKRDVQQLADAWNRLARAERALFGDTQEVIDILRKARDLDPANMEVERSLKEAEEKQDFADRLIKEAAELRAALAKQP